MTIPSVLIRSTWFALGLSFLFAGGAVAQSERGEITGRVVTPDGEPIPDAQVSARPQLFDLNPYPEHQVIVRTDETGRFHFRNLRSRQYFIHAVAPGFFRNERIEATQAGTTQMTVTLRRCGVITGRVTGPDGLPLVEATVKFRDISSANPGVKAVAVTDDRGRYRRWGLIPGRYLVSVESVKDKFGPVGALNGDATTFYPNSTLTGAKPVVVTEGGETSGIDIRHRAFHGFVIPGQGSDKNPRSFLFDAVSHFPIQGPVSGSSAHFMLRGVPAGEYDLLTIRNESDAFFPEPTTTPSPSSHPTGGRPVLSTIEYPLKLRWCPKEVLEGDTPVVAPCQPVEDFKIDGAP